MTTFTKEQLISHARESVSYLENVKGRVSKEGADCKVVLEMVERDLELARIALTSLEAEPVAVNDDMAYAFHHALSDSSPGADEVEEIKAGLRAAFANVTTQPAPVVPEFETWFNSRGVREEYMQHTDSSFPSGNFMERLLRRHASGERRWYPHQ